MTAGVVIVLPAEILLIADNLSVDAASGKAIAGANKLFVHAGKSAMFSYGVGPGDVQEKIARLDPSILLPASLAVALSQAFGDLAPPYGFGLFVAGFDGTIPSLCHVAVPASDPGIDDRSTVGGMHPVCPRGTEVALGAFLMDGQHRLDPVALGVEFVQRAHALVPHLVGADARQIRVTSAGAEWI